MQKKRSEVRRLVLSSAIAAILLAARSQAADTPADKGGSLEEVVVTGSLIKGSREDAALPVEVISEEAIENMGRPSNLDLVKTMSEVGQVAGEAYRYNGYPIGAATINLRNLGARYTTVIFNGKRFPEQFSATTGRFNNINWIPNAAIGSVELLKEGGAVTYGADAVGGVVNYITRRNLNGLEVRADYRYIQDSSGDYTSDLSWGKKFDSGNLLVVAGYQHRGNLSAIDRDFATIGPFENRTASNWVSSGSPGSYAFLTAPGQAGTGLIVPSNTASLNQYLGDRQISSASGLVRDPNCNALGGVSGWSATPSPACYLEIAQFEALVQKEDQYQLYVELNNSIGRSMNLHTEFLYYQQDLPDIYAYPGDAPGAFPLATSLPLSGGNFTTQTSGSSAYFVSGHNPAVGQFLDNFFNSDGVTPAFTPAQRTAITTTGRAALLSGIWREFGNGGNPSFGKNDSQHNNNQLARLATDLKIDLGNSGLTFDVGGAYSHVKYSIDIKDVLVDRLQAALNGLGGANCNGIEAGTAGSTCQWLNPFSSAIPKNIYSGAVNPGYVPALANDPSLVNWLYVPISLDRNYDYVVLDSLVSGKTGWDLPGGPMAIAAGVQYRYTREEFLVDDLSNRDINPCATIGVTNCSTKVGPLAYTRPATVLGTTQNLNRQYPVVAAYAEAQFPIFDSLNLQVAGRYEKFFSDVTDNDNSVFVPAAALKWQPIQWLGYRVSWGKTFSQVNPPKDDGPNVTAPVSVFAPNTAYGNISGYTTAGYDNVEVKPQNGQYFSTGLLFQPGNFTANIDYFYISIDEFTRTMTANNVLRALVGTGALPTQQLDCSSALFTPRATLGGNPFVQLASPCVQGVTTLSSIGAGSVINYYDGTDLVNSGKLSTSGIDLSANYRFDDVVGGILTPSVDLTYNTKWNLGDFTLNGITVAPGYDGLGLKNTAANGRLGLAVPKWRGSFGLNYSVGRHNLNVFVSYTPSITNEDPTDFDVSNDQNLNIGNAAGVVTTGTPAAQVCTVPVAAGTTTNIGSVPAGAGTGQFGVGGAGTGTTARGFCPSQSVAYLAGETIESNTNVDVTYRMRMTDTFSMTLSVYNLLDRDPSFDRSTVGYNPGFGSPLKRNIKLGFQAKF